MASPVGKNNTDTHLFNAKVTLTDDWSLIRRTSTLSIDETMCRVFVRDAFGARLAGNMKAGDGNIALTWPSSRRSPTQGITRLATTRNTCISMRSGR